jgi:CheY-like chemotaxis protein
MTITTALIVDDEDTSRDLARGVLTALGVAQIYVAGNGHEAIRSLKSIPQPDLILLDIFMPEKDGIEFIDDLAKSSFAGGLILMSSNGSQFLELAQLLAKRRSLKIWGVLDKPLTVGEVATAIEKGLSG